MAVSIRITVPQDTRLSLKAPNRTLIQHTPPTQPMSPAESTSCAALTPDMQQCPLPVQQDSYTWCNAHFSELKNLSYRWRRAQKEAESIQVVNPDTAKEVTMKLRLAVELRRQIKKRFCTRGEDTADFLAWLLRLERDIRGAADAVLMGNLTRNPIPATPGGGDTPCPGLEKIMIFMSPLDPRVPIESLQGMSDDGTILVLKHFYVDLCQEAIQHLYTIVPDLYDGPPHPGVLKSTAPDRGTDIVRAWFRIVVLNDSDADTLAHATRARGIDEYLHGCHASELEMYCDFFENAWRPHAVKHLRAAICAQTLAGAHVKSVRLLGGNVPSTSAGFMMGKPSWDILYRWFPTLLTQSTLATICANFDEYLTICQLLMLGLYREHWFDRQSLLLQCTTGVYLGFIPSKSEDMSAIVGTKQEGAKFVETEARNYICGQMAMSDPLTEDFLNELRKRTERLHVVMYEGTNPNATVCPSGKDVFIRRRRTAGSIEDLKDASWSVECTLEDVKNDLRLRKSSTYDPIVVDSWEFIIIDREPGLPFQLFDIIQDVLLMLTGDPTPRQIARRVIGDVIPSPVQDIYLNEMSIDSSKAMYLRSTRDVQYEGNRQRCFNPDQRVVLAQKANMAAIGQSKTANRFIRRVVEDMERCGLISLAKEYEEPQVKPVVVQGTDGALDLYFPYPQGGISSGDLSPRLTLPSKDCLLHFAQNFKDANPSAIMAKGSIQTHYCAWPMPPVRRQGQKKLNFATYEGHIYQWNVLPFDTALSQNAWQYILSHYFNSKFPFVMFYLTTFVVCAKNEEDIERVTATLLDETDKRGWRISLPDASGWSTSVDELKLGEMFNGTQPV
ncbi:hypothetical protein M011DRAFT_496021 [Sporormia fimetaria CBS 119925]|uniref:Uncharacterized protein n=1 Tax=Sporormia fimetaria CBS 119925 TaxID=1340428 RepID=A0A6A6V5Z5_9PLEO|nr:hypothetical protein M011DRAFT_496021 [Sporormia fimetaria CBS 119925]